MAVLAGLAAVGCGEDGLSASEYRNQVNGMCREAEKTAMELEQPKAPEDLAPFLREGAKLSEKSREEFRSLEAPDELVDAHEESAELGDGLIAQLRALADALDKGGDPARVFAQAIPGLNGTAERGNAIARDIGLGEECIVEPITIPGQPPA